MEKHQNSKSKSKIRRVKFHIMNYLNYYQVLYVSFWNTLNTKYYTEVDQLITSKLKVFCRLR